MSFQQALDLAKHTQAVRTFLCETELWGIPLMLLFSTLASLGLALMWRFAQLCFCRLTLVYRRSDPNCGREWPQDRHTLFRVRLSCRATTTHIRATLIDIFPPVMDMRGASLSFMNKDDERHDYTLTRHEPWYIDVFDYNSKDETTRAPILFLYNKSPRPPWESVPVRSYVVTIRASGYRGGIRRRLLFTADGVTPPTFRRLYWWSRPSV